jgi:hypothetical protein
VTASFQSERCLADGSALMEGCGRLEMSAVISYFRKEPWQNKQPLVPARTACRGSTNQMALDNLPVLANGSKIVKSGNGFAL